MKLTNSFTAAVVAAFASSTLLDSAHASTSLKGIRGLQDNKNGSIEPGVVLKSTVVAELTSDKYGQLTFLTFPESPADVVVHFKTSGQYDVMHEFMIRTTESSQGQVEMTPVQLFEMYTELAGMKVEVPPDLRAAVDFVINQPVKDDAPLDVKLPELPGLVPMDPTANRNLESHQRQLDQYYGSDEWFEDFHCSYREVPNSNVCSCYTTFGTPGDEGAFYTRSRKGLFQTAYNFFDGSFGHKIEKCTPSNGVCTFQTLMDDNSVRKYELSKIWHFSYGPEIIYRTHVYDGYLDSFHLSVNELKVYFFPYGCVTDGHGCYTCPNIY